MAMLLDRFMLFAVLLCSSSGTRFLPSVIWDSANPLLCCPYNWLVVSRVDQHDIMDFVCPTSKLVKYQVSDHTRLRESMNFNLFRREWTGSVEDLKTSIRNGSIHSFCNVSHPESVKLSTCRKGEYKTFQVKFTHFVFDPVKIKQEKYEKDKTYVFYSNGDGQDSSLNSKQAKCNMLFAVHTVSKKKNQFDLTYGKEVVPSKCKCDPYLKPTLAPTTSISQEVSTTSQPPTTSPLPSKSQEPISTKRTMTSTTTTTNDATVKHSEKKSTVTECTSTKKTTKSTGSDDSQKESETETDENWLSLSIFIAVVVASFIVGILSAVLFFQVIWRRPPRKDGYNNAFYSKRERNSIGTPDGTLSNSERSDV